MHKTYLIPTLLASFCLLCACGETTENTTTADTSSSAAAETTILTMPEATQSQPEITALSFHNNNLTLDIDETSYTLTASITSDDIVTTSHVQIYAADPSLVEISDWSVDKEGKIKFTLTGKQAGSSQLYLATADGSLVSEPLEFEVRSEEEREYAEQPIYFSVTGDYWHLSKSCAQAEINSSGTAYNQDGEEISINTPDIPINQGTRGNPPNGKTPCPDCVGTDAQ